MNNQANGFGHERAGQKRVRDVDEMDSECLPISKRINSLSLNTPFAHGMGSSRWSAPGPSGALSPPAAGTAATAASDPPLHMPMLVGGPAAPAPAQAPPPPPPPLPAEPDLSPEECPEYFTINSYLYQLHMERLRRQQGGQF